MTDRDTSTHDDSAGHDEAPVETARDLPFMPPREGTRWTEDSVRPRLLLVREVLVDLESDAGARVHRLGTRLRELYAHFAELALGHRTFVAFARAEFGLKRTETYDALKLALHATEAQARGYGVSRCLKGLRLIELLGVDSFDALRKVPLTLEDGTVTHFPATRRELESALRALKSGQGVQERLPRVLTQELRRLNGGLDTLRATDPQLAGVRARFVAVDGAPQLVVGRVGRAQWVALARALLRLEREN